MKKLLILSLILSMVTVPCFALEFDEIIEVRPPAYRVGLSEDPEREYVEAKYPGRVDKVEQQVAKRDEGQIDASDLTYADLSIKQISKEIARELDMDQEFTVGDLSLLWQGAATQSDVINFALYKLSNPEQDKPDEKSVKKVLSTIASMSTLVGAGMGSPILATGSIIGGNVLGIMSQDTKALNYKYSKVTDADMIILVRKIEELQQRTVDLYYNYMTSRKKLDLVDKLVADRKKNYDSSQQSAREIILITDAYYRTSLDMQMKARSDFYSARASIEQFVGNDVFKQFEDIVKGREKNND